jgi:hypothetical protein
MFILNENTLEQFKMMIGHNSTTAVHEYSLFSSKICFKMKNLPVILFRVFQDFFSPEN